MVFPYMDPYIKFNITYSSKLNLFCNGQMNYGLYKSKNISNLFNLLRASSLIGNNLKQIILKLCCRSM